MRVADMSRAVVPFDQSTRFWYGLEELAGCWDGARRRAPTIEEIGAGRIGCIAVDRALARRGDQGRADDQPDGACLRGRARLPVLRTCFREDQARVNGRRRQVQNASKYSRCSQSVTSV